MKNRITHDDYKNCLLYDEEENLMRTMNVIRSHLHDVYTGDSGEVNKVALSAKDDKRLIMEDEIHTKAYGHYSLKTEGGGEHTRGSGRNIKSVTYFILQSRCLPKNRPICGPRFLVSPLFPDRIDTPSEGG